MKKLSVILTTSVILVLTMVFITNTPAQDTNPRIYMDNADQSWSSISGLIIAHHDVPMEPDTWDDLDFYEISDFIDESIKNGTLLGYGSGAFADKRLNILKDKIDTAANILESGTFWL